MILCPTKKIKKLSSSKKLGLQIKGYLPYFWTKNKDMPFIFARRIWQEAKILLKIKLYSLFHNRV